MKQIGMAIDYAPPRELEDLADRLNRTADLAEEYNFYFDGADGATKFRALADQLFTIANDRRVEEAT